MPTNELNEAVERLLKLAKLGPNFNTSQRFDLLTVCAAALPVQHEASCQAMREACGDAASNRLACVGHRYLAEQVERSILATPIPAYVAPAAAETDRRKVQAEAFSTASLVAAAVKEQYGDCSGAVVADRIIMRLAKLHKEASGEIEVKHE